MTTRRRLLSVLGLGCALTMVLPGCAGPGATSSASPSPVRYSVVSSPPSTQPDCNLCQAPGTATSASSPAASASAPDQAALDAALRTAASKNEVAEVTRLLTAGADVNAKSSSQESAYLLAASDGATEVVALLLTKGAKVDDLDSYHGTALIRAADRGHATICGMLLRAGIAKDHVNRLGWQAIHEAVWLGKGDERYQATVRILVAGGVQLDRPDTSNNLTPLGLAKKKGQSEVVAILEKAASPYNGNPATNLVAAATSPTGATDVALAIRAGAPVTTTDSQGRTLIAAALASGNLAGAKVLYGMGAPTTGLDPATIATLTV